MDMLDLIERQQLKNLSKLMNPWVKYYFPSANAAWNEDAESRIKANMRPEVCLEILKTKNKYRHAVSFDFHHTLIGERHMSDWCRLQVMDILNSSQDMPLPAGWRNPMPFYISKPAVTRKVFYSQATDAFRIASTLATLFADELCYNSGYKRS